MKIFTNMCSECKTIVAANELESSRVMKCPGVNCDSVLRFTDLDDEVQKYFLQHRDQYQI